MRPELVAVIMLVGVTGCAPEAFDSPDESPVLVLDRLDTLVSTESALIAHPSDITVAPDGDVYVADRFSDRLIRLPANGSAPVTIGREGKGPSEFDSPEVIRAGDSVVAVIDRGNGRIQRLDRDGRFLSSTLLGPHSRLNRPWLEEDGSVLIGTMGKNAALAVLQDSLGTISAAFGKPVVSPPHVYNVTAIKAQIANGNIPDEFRNDVLVAQSGTDAVWILLQSDGVIRRYDSAGILSWELAPTAPEMAEILDTFFRRNEEGTRPDGFSPLRYFADLQPVGNELWVLLARPMVQSATLLRVSPEGSLAGRIEVPRAIGARSFSYDEDRSLLYLGTTDDAQVVVAAVQ